MKWPAGLNLQSRAGAERSAAPSHIYKTRCDHALPPATGVLWPSLPPAIDAGITWYWGVQHISFFFFFAQLFLAETDHSVHLDAFCFNMLWDSPFLNGIIIVGCCVFAAASEIVHVVSNCNYGREVLKIHIAEQSESSIIILIFWCISEMPSTTSVLRN